MANYQVKLNGLNAMGKSWGFGVGMAGLLMACGSPSTSSTDSQADSGESDTEKSSKDDGDEDSGSAGDSGSKTSTSTADSGDASSDEDAETSESTGDDDDDDDDDDDNDDDDDDVETSASTGDDDDDDNDDDTSESTGDDDDDDDDDAETSESTGDDDDDDVETSESTGDDDDDDDIDCENLPALPLSYEVLTNMPTCEDFTFNDKGDMICIGLEDRMLYETKYKGASKNLFQVGTVGPEPFPWIRGARFLPNGDLAVADPKNNTILRVGLDGSTETLISDASNPNGVAIDLQGNVYVTLMTGEVIRIDPETKERTSLYKASGEKKFDGISFSKDYKSLFLNVEDEFSIYELPVSPGGDLTEIAKLESIGMQGARDGMAVDHCGNLYVVEMLGMIHRIDKDHKIERVVDVRPEAPQGRPFITAINFGSGHGGWKEDHLYLMATTKKMIEVPVGVRGKKEVHLESRR